jgi:type IV pilus assembly protein PilM
MGEDRTLVAGGGPDATTETNIELATVTRPVLAELVREIRRSFDFYEKQLYEKPVERIYLTGGSSKFISLPERLSEELGTEVLAGNPFQFIIYDEAAQDVEDLNSRAPMLAVATGLAVREVQP